MKLIRLALLVCTCCIPGTQAADDFGDDLAEALSFSSRDGVIRGKVSGTVDLEGYAFSKPAPALIEASGDRLFNPRLTTFIDAQLGSELYFFAQGRVDRGFDPSDEKLEARLDEYALRLTPWLDGRFSLQVGKFAAVIGNWIPRHGSWDNPFVNAPLPYENLTGMWDSMAVPSLGTLLGWAHLRPRPGGESVEDDKYQRLPVIWGPSYATGAAVSGELGRLTYAAEVKARSLSSRPYAWTASVLEARHPTVSGRLGVRPNQMWNIGLSVSRGVYLDPAAAHTIPGGHRLAEYRQTVIGQDVSFAWHHLQVWAELYAARFAIPRIGNADTVVYYVETRYKLTPQWFVAARWNEQMYGRLSDVNLGRVRWGANLRRVDVAVAHRFTPNSELKLQYSLSAERNPVHAYGHLAAVQLVLKY